MPKFSLTQLMMGMALVSILLVLSLSEKIGERYAMIESLSFSRDSSLLIASKLMARDARVPLKKQLKTDFKRKLSFIEVSDVPVCKALPTGSLDVSGFSARVWHRGRTSALWFSDSEFAVGSFDSNSLVTADLNKGNPTTIAIPHPANNFATTKSGDLIAFSGASEFTVWSTKSKSRVLRGAHSNMLFLWSTPLVFSRDGSELFVANESQVNRWDISNGQKSGFLNVLTPIEDKSSINEIAIGPDDTLVVCASTWVRHYDGEGDLLSTLLPNGCSLCDSSAGGDRLVVANYDYVACFEMNTGNLLQKIPIDNICALAVSPDGKHIAVGDYDGFVTLYVFATGEKLWKLEPRGSQGVSWPIPFGCLLLWGIVAVLIFCSSQRNAIVAAA